MWALSITLMSITCPHGYTPWAPFVSGIPIAPVAALKAQPLTSLFRHRRPDNVSHRRRSRRLDERHVKRRRRDPYDITIGSIYENKKSFSGNLKNIENQHLSSPAG